MPQADTGESKRLTTKAANHGASPPEQEQHPCPRCDSTNTKFCYYNNYNYSQPRHFCKSCRRYWTHGGTLRDIPVGGGSRKSAKRSRTSNHSSSAAASANYEAQSFPLSTTPVLMPLAGNQDATVQFCDVKGNGSFTSLLNNSAAQGGAPGFLALGGFGLGIGQGFEEVGFGLGRGIWPFVGVGGGDGGGGGGGGAVVNGLGGNATVTVNGGTWQYENGGESATAFVGGDCFSWPDLAISTPRNGLK